MWCFRKDMDAFLNDSILWNEIIIQFSRWLLFCPKYRSQGTDAPPSSLAYTPRNTTHKSHRQGKHPYPISPAPTCTSIPFPRHSFVLPSSQPHRRLSSRPAVPQLTVVPPSPPTRDQFEDERSVIVISVASTAAILVASCFLSC